MPLPEAMRFIERLEDDLALQSKVRDLFPVQDLSEVVRVAAEAGFDFDVAELREAFRADWKLRRRFYGG